MRVCVRACFRERERVLLADGFATYPLHEDRPVSCCVFPLACLLFIVGLLVHVVFRVMPDIDFALTVLR
jgi:hypothetical protein